MNIPLLPIQPSPNYSSPRIMYSLCIHSFFLKIPTQYLLCVAFFFRKRVTGLLLPVELSPNSLDSYLSFQMISTFSTLSLSFRLVELWRSVNCHSMNVFYFVCIYSCHFTLLFSFSILAIWWHPAHLCNFGCGVLLPLATPDISSL